MRKFVPVAGIDEIPPGTAKAFAVGDYEVALFNVGGTFYGTTTTGGDYKQGTVFAVTP